MRQLVQRLQDGVVHLVETPTPACGSHEILVETRASLVSAGTERAKVDLAQANLFQKARRRPEDVSKVLDRVRREGLLSTVATVRERLVAASPLGYSASGVVIGVGELVTDMAVGDRAACAGAGYANHAEYIRVPGALAVRLPEGVEFGAGCYATVGAIAMQGLRQAEVALGDWVCVIGLGLVGQITSQLAHAAGCRVIGVDPDASRCALARELGAEATYTHASNAIPGIAAATGGLGVDATIICAATGSNEPVQTAGRIARDRGVVVIVGDVGMDVPRADYYHKELQLRLSRSYGPGRYDTLYEEYGLDYPTGWVKWTERRNMAEFLRLVDCGAVDVSKLTTHTEAFDDAPAAYAMLMDDSRRDYLGVVLEYASAIEERRIDLAPRVSPPSTPETIGVSLIGCGHFATATLIPALRHGAVDLRGVVSSGGLSAADVARRLGFKYASSSAEDVFGDGGTHAVVIATRHDTHASYVCDALESNKHAYVEKPLATTSSDLERIITTWNESSSLVMVGFNRRYSDIVKRLVHEVRDHSSPSTILIRVNAGAIGKEHWSQDIASGGGRIVGELCHFVDLASYLAGGAPITVYACALASTEALALRDSLSVSISFAGGSVASIIYSAVGDRSLSKEYIEVHSGGTSWRVDDFHTLHTNRGGKLTRLHVRGQDKGHQQAVTAFLESIQGVPDVRSSFRDSVISTYATLAVIESLSKGSAVQLADLSISRDGGTR